MDKTTKNFLMALSGLAVCLLGMLLILHNYSIGVGMGTGNLGVALILRISLAERSSKVKRAANILFALLLSLIAAIFILAASGQHSRLLNLTEAVAFLAYALVIAGSALAISRKPWNDKDLEGTLGS